MAAAVFPFIQFKSTAKESQYQCPKDTGIIHHMKGPHFQYIQEENGEMFCRDMCDCGCIDKKWKINEGDTVIAFQPALTGNLKRLKIISQKCKFYRTTTLTGCSLYARDFEKYPLYPI